MKKDTSYTLKRAEHFKFILIWEGLCIGVIAGLIVTAYRIALEYAGSFTGWVCALLQAHPWVFGFWLAFLCFLAFLVGRLVKWEPLISGSGIPQLEGEIGGKLRQSWPKVLLAKFVGGFLSLAGGLSLGREGPSIQLGAMAGKAFSKGLKRGKTEEKYLLTCGASAGLSAAFQAPLAGVMFSLEEVHKNFSVSVLISVMAASLTANIIASGILGFEPVFQFSLTSEILPSYYWHIIVLGILLGLLGAFYNVLTIKVQNMFYQIPHLNETTRLLIPFLLAGILAFVFPSLLGSGHPLINLAAGGSLALGSYFLLFAGKLLFSLICFGSGAPGGIFFPLLVLGSLIGGGYAAFAVQFLGLPSFYISNFVILAMAGFFTAVVRAPITGIILIFEMTGDLSQMLTLSMVSIAAYMTALLLKSKPIYESLLESLLKRRGVEIPKATGEKILQEFLVSMNCPVQDKAVQDISWPEGCLLVSVQRGGTELIPKGDTVLRHGDTIVTMTSYPNAASVYDQVSRLCEERPL